MSHQGKLLERLILNRLKPALGDVIPANQFGFTIKSWTQDAILVSRLLGIDATKRHTGLVRGYIDLPKAYDKVNREVLWRILRLYGVPEAIVVVIIGFHEAAQAVLQLNGEISPVHIPLNRGLKQGSVLSSLECLQHLLWSAYNAVRSAHFIRHGSRCQSAVQSRRRIY